MQSYETIQRKFIKNYSKDRNLALSTSVHNTPSVRIIDAYYHQESFYIVTHNHSQKIKNISVNKNVCLCNNENFFYGKAINIGHPLDESNMELRELLTSAFHKWYFEHNDESDSNMCYLKIEIETAEVTFGKSRFSVNFMKKTIERKT